nr:hypothetical protein [Tanacetum cinerariifolium]
MPMYIIVKNTRKMDMTIDQQVELDEALVNHASRLRIGKSNFRLRSDISSKESTLQQVYNVLRLTPFYKAFLVTADVPKIYMHEFWATATVHHHSIRFKMENKKRIVNLEYFREMMHICPRLPGQTFDDLPFEKEILAFIQFLGHNGEIRRLTDGLYHKKNVDFAYLLWEDFVYQVEHNNAKKSNEMYYPRLSTSAKGKQPAKASKAKSLTVLSEVAMTEAEQLKLATKRSLQQTHISQASGLSIDKGTGIIPGVPDVPTEEEEGQDEEDDKDELYRDVNINLEGRVVQMEDVHTTQEYEDAHVTLTSVNPDGIDSIFETTSQMDVQALTTVAPLTLSAPTLTPSTIATISTVPQAPNPPTTALSILLQDLPNLGSLFRFDHRLKTLEANFSEFVQTNQFVGVVSSILRIVQSYMDQRMNEAVKVAVQIQSNRLREEAQAENEEFLKNLDKNIQKIIKEQVKEQVKVQVSKILLKIKKTVNEELEAEVLTRSSNSSKTSYAVAADLSEMELKKILIEKMEGNKSIHQSDEQRNLYKALIKNPPLDQTGGPRSKEKERSQSAVDDQPIAEASQHPEWFQQQKKPPTPNRDWNKTLLATHESIQLWISKLAKQTDSRSSFNELMATPVDFSAFLMNQLKVDTLTPELIAGPTYELMKGSCKSLVELEFFLEEVYKETTDQLDWNNPEGQQYPHNLLKPLPLIPNSQGRRVILFDHFINNDLEYLCGGAFSRKYTTSVTKTKAAYYGYIKWIEDLVPRTMWSQGSVSYDKYAL